MRQRQVVCVIGPSGAGKTSVAHRVAGARATHVDTNALYAAILERVRCGAWPDALVQAPALVLDGPVYLHNRPGVLAVLGELLRLRRRAGGRTALCQTDDDGSLHLLSGLLDPGTVVTIGLRYPTSRRARRRFARRICAELGLPAEAGFGTEKLTPWTYEAVIDRVRAWPGPSHEVPARWRAGSAEGG